MPEPVLVSADLLRTLLQIAAGDRYRESQNEIAIANRTKPHSRHGTGRRLMHENRARIAYQSSAEYTWMLDAVQALFDAERAAEAAARQAERDARAMPPEELARLIKDLNL